MESKRFFLGFLIVISLISLVILISNFIPNSEGLTGWVSKGGSGTTIQYSCSDTDRGIDEFNLGIATSRLKTTGEIRSQVTDYCQNENYLQEAFCNSRGYASLRTISCELVCSEGICIRPCEEGKFLNEDNNCVECLQDIQCNSKGKNFVCEESVCVEKINEIQRKDKILVLLFDYPNSGTNGNKRNSPEEIENLFFGEETTINQREFTVKKFYEELSYGKYSLEGEVFPWKSIYPESQIIGENCNYNWPSEEILSSRINELELNIQDYDWLSVIVDNNCLFEHFPYGGMGEITITQKEIPYRTKVIFMDSLYGGGIEHEIYHILEDTAKSSYFQPHHPGVLDCQEGIINSEECIFFESKNKFDMSSTSGLHSFHFNAFIKDEFNWFNNNEILIINNSGNSIYSISPIEFNPLLTKNGKVSAKIILPGEEIPEYYLEYRQPIGIDKYFGQVEFFDGKGNYRTSKGNLEGLFIYKKYLRQDGKIFYPQMDMSPRHNPDEQDNLGSVDLDQVVLTKNNEGLEIFHDEENGITIGPIIEANSENISFYVSINQNQKKLVQNTPPKLYSNSNSLNEIEEKNKISASDIEGNLKNYSWEFISCESNCPEIKNNEKNLSNYFQIIDYPKIENFEEGDYILRLKVFDHTNLFSEKEFSLKLKNSKDLEIKVVPYPENPKSGEPVVFTAKINSSIGIGKVSIYSANRRLPSIIKTCTFNNENLREATCTSSPMTFSTGIQRYYALVSNYRGSEVIEERSPSFDKEAIPCTGSRYDPDYCYNYFEVF